MHRHKYSWVSPTSGKIGLGSANFQHSGIGYIEIAVFVLWLIFVDFSQNFSERALLVRKSQSRFQSRKSVQWNRLHWNSRLCSMTILIRIFCILVHPFMAFFPGIPGSVSFPFCAPPQPVPLRINEWGFLWARCSSCYSTIRVKALKGTQSINPNHWPGHCLILSSSNTGLVTERAILSLYWLSDVSTSTAQLCTPILCTSHKKQTGRFEIQIK